MDLARLESALGQAAQNPRAFPGVEALAEAVGVDRPTLEGLFRVHVQSPPAAFLQEVRCRWACARLAEGKADLDALGAQCGFPRTATFRTAFRDQTGLDPGAFRDMLGTDRFSLPLPARLRVADVLAFHGRDPASVSERVFGTDLLKAFLCHGRPAVLRLSFLSERIEVSLAGATGPGAMALAHRAALRLLGWQGDPTAFEAAHPDLAAGREGLRVLLTLDPFEALVWAILGQQINLGFAYALRRDLIRRAGVPAPEGLIAHPDAAAIARLGAEGLLPLRFSRSKAAYLLTAAAEAAAGRLDLNRILTATGALQRLLALRGCGPWTAQYVLMRGLGFPDGLPLGDAGLTLALQRRFNLAERPDAAETCRLMAPYAPHRSLATFHLWASLKGMPA